MTGCLFGKQKIFDDKHKKVDERPGMEYHLLDYHRGERRGKEEWGELLYDWTG